MMRGKPSVLATPLTCSLLLRFTDRQHAPHHLTGQVAGHTPHLLPTTEVYRQAERTPSPHRIGIYASTSFIKKKKRTVSWSSVANRTCERRIRIWIQIRINHFKQRNLLTFSIFMGHFCPSWIWAWIGIRIQGPHGIRIQSKYGSGSTALLSGMWEPSCADKTWRKLYGIFISARPGINSPLRYRYSLHELLI